LFVDQTAWWYLCKTSGCYNSHAWSRSSEMAIDIWCTTTPWYKGLNVLMTMDQLFHTYNYAAVVVW